MSTTSAINLSDLSPDQIASLESSVRTKLEPEIRQQLKEQNTVDIAKFKDEIRQQNQEDFEKALVKFEEEEKAKRKPLTTDEIQRLLSKEYITFDIELQDYESKIHKFTIRELPQNLEKDLYKGAKEIVTDLVTHYNQISFKVVDNDLFQNILSLMELFEPIQKFLAMCCVTILDPRKKDPKITVDWIQDNLTNYRITTIIMAQVEVNRMRDFFSILSQGFQSVRTKE